MKSVVFQGPGDFVVFFTNDFLFVAPDKENTGYLYCSRIYIIESGLFYVEGTSASDCKIHKVKEPDLFFEDLTDKIRKTQDEIKKCIEVLGEPKITVPTIRGEALAAVQKDKSIMDTGYVSDGIRYSWGSNSEATLPTGITYQQPTEIMQREARCECGSEACHSPRHSDWCPKYVGNK